MIKSTIAKTPTDLERTIFQIYADGGKVVTTVALKVESIKGRSYMDVIEFMVFYEEPITIKVDHGQIAEAYKDMREFHREPLVPLVTRGDIDKVLRTIPRFQPPLPNWWPRKISYVAEGKPRPILPVIEYRDLPEEARYFHNPECRTCGNNGKVIIQGAMDNRVEDCPAVGCVWKTQYE